MNIWLLGLGIFIFVCILEWIREILTFQITRYEIRSPKLNDLEKPKKAILLADLHNTQYGKQNKKLLQAIKKEAPDLIFITGDMLIGKPSESGEKAYEFVSKLPSICKTYYANGNHEQRIKEHPEIYGMDYTEYRSRLEACGVIFLENQRITEEWGKNRISIGGLEIPLTFYRRGRRLTLSTEMIETCIGRAQKEEYEILLAHNPAFVESYLEWGADLVLGGHMHGGVVRIPGIGGIITPQYRLFPKYSGEFTKRGNASVVISKGLGMHTLKIRFLNPAEMIVLQIGGETGGYTGEVTGV